MYIYFYIYDTCKYGAICRTYSKNYFANLFNQLFK